MITKVLFAGTSELINGSNHLVCGIIYRDQPEIFLFQEKRYIQSVEDSKLLLKGVVELGNAEKRHCFMFIGRENKLGSENRQPFIYTHICVYITGYFHT